MKSSGRMTRRQMLELAEKVVKTITGNKNLFPAPPVDVQSMHATIMELSAPIAGFPSAHERMRRERKEYELRQQLNKLMQYIKKLKV